MSTGALSWVFLKIPDEGTWARVFEISRRIGRFSAISDYRYGKRKGKKLILKEDGIALVGNEPVLALLRCRLINKTKEKPFFFLAFCFFAGDFDASVQLGWERGNPK